MIRTIVAVVVLMAAIFFIGKAGINRNQEADATGTSESQAGPTPAQAAMMNQAERPFTVIFVVEGQRPVGAVHMHDCLRAGVA